MDGQTPFLYMALQAVVGTGASPVVVDIPCYFSHRIFYKLTSLPNSSDI